MGSRSCLHFLAHGQPCFSGRSRPARRACIPGFRAQSRCRAQEPRGKGRGAEAESSRCCPCSGSQSTAGLRLYLSVGGTLTPSWVGAPQPRDLSSSPLGSHVQEGRGRTSAPLSCTRHACFSASLPATLDCRYGSCRVWGKRGKAPRLKLSDDFWHFLCDLLFPPNDWSCT